MGIRWVEVVACALGVACAGSMPLTDEHETRARAALQPFKRELLGALVNALPEGPPAAVDVCAVEAPKIAAAHASDGIAMGRTSDRLRNLLNTPEPWMRPILESYAATTGADPEPPRLIRVNNHRFGYVEPIYVKDMCLTCHGTDVDAGVEEALAVRYPDDAAVGFSAGEFRGVFWVTMPIER